LHYDECNVCGGSGLKEGACNCRGDHLDCNLKCGGKVGVDECGVCGGPGIRKDLGHCNCDGHT